MKKKDWLVYIVRCKDRSLYAGITTDLEKRLKRHNEGKAAKYTRGRRPVELIYSESCKNESTARKRELEVKKLPRKNKLKVANIKDLLDDLHNKRNFKHKQISWLLGVPRPTITRWFREFKLPTKSCRRFTDQNLKSWLYKTGKLEKKVRYEGPNRTIQRTKNNVNVDFFKK